MTETAAKKQITRTDVQQSLTVQQEMLKTASKYYRRVLEMAQASTEFATALDAIAQCHGAEQAGSGLQTAAELHRAIAKH